FDQRERGRGRGDGKRVAQFAERHYAAADRPSAGAVFARSGAAVSQYNWDADEYLQVHAGFRVVQDTAAAHPRTPFAHGGDFESEPWAKPVEVRGRRDADLGLRLLPVAIRWGVFLRRHFGESVVFTDSVCADAWGAGVNPAAGVGAQCAAILRAEFRESGVASEQQRLRGVRAGHDAADAALQLKSGSALRPADVLENGNGRQSVLVAGGEDAVARDELCAAGGNRVCDRQRSAAHGAGGIRNFLYPHSAGLSVGGDQ